jgi:FKBP-type peptidyl-prolyl cis-trans isomerase SlyD
MKIQENMVVSVTYSLTAKTKNETEEVFIERAETSMPFTFLSGSGGVLPEFEQNLTGLSVGESFDFFITSENAYGNIDEQMIIDIPVEAFIGPDGKIEEGLLKVNNILPMMDNEGNQLEGIIREVGLQKVKMDFNHPLAGKDLHFVGRVESIRPATPEELEHGHVHGVGGHHHQ